MSKYGIKIKIYQAGSVYEVSLGVRQNYDCKDAMLSNSLFSDYMREHGLKVWRDVSTRDVISIDFSYGSSSYAEAVRKLQRKMKHAETQELKDKYQSKIDGLAEIADKFDKKSREELREYFYEHGVDISYPTYDSSRHLSGSITIHYKMLYRTPGKAKKGSCMFIRDSLYNKARNYLYMGIKLPKENAPIVEMGAYSSLVTSTIEGKIRIAPEEILMLRDVEASFTTNVISIETDDAKRCHAVPRQDYTLKNNMFDGQALIDESIFPDYADGYILLRHHFTKMAAFCSRIQLFFKDYYGKDYENATITDMFGNIHKVTDIKLITTESAAKWIKVGATYERWCEWVRQNDCMFGIVKTAHESKLGSVQRMSYQMVNALTPEIMEDVMRPSMQELWRMKKDDHAFIKYLRKYSDTFANDYEVIVAICDKNPEFIKSEYFRQRKKHILNQYLMEMKTGHIVQNADNLTIVGSPYAMLLHSVGEDVENDKTFVAEDGAIQCWTGRFEDGEYLAGFRSPFNSRNNMGHLHNHAHPLLKRYFNLGKLIIAVNMLHTDFQDKNNGSDQDSDSLYVTNQSDIVAHAKYCVAHYPTIVNNIPKEKVRYSSSMKDYAFVDNNLSHSQRTIGESSNLAQICLSYTYNCSDKKYEEYVCILSVIAQASIDSTKRRFDIDIPDEISRIRADMDIDINGYPAFWQAIRPEFNKDRINDQLQCPMNSLYVAKPKSYKPGFDLIPTNDFVREYEYKKPVKCSKRIAELIEKYRLELSSTSVAEKDDQYDAYLLLRSDFDDLVANIRRLSMSHKYAPLVSYLVRQAFGNDDAGKRLRKNRSILLKALYTANPDVFLEVFLDGKPA